jgi:hypothetical protein
LYNRANLTIVLLRYLAKVKFMDEPNENNIGELLRGLDRENNSVIHIEMPSGTLTAIGSQYDRVKMYFDSNGMTGFPRILRLVDPACHSWEEMHIIYSNGEEDSIPLVETVPLEKAIEVARFFLKHNRFPSNLIWSKYMCVLKPTGNNT